MSISYRKTKNRKFYLNLDHIYHYTFKHLDFHNLVAKSVITYPLEEYFSKNLICFIIQLDAANYDFLARMIV